MRTKSLIRALAASLSLAGAAAMPAAAQGVSLRVAPDAPRVFAAPPAAGGADPPAACEAAADAAERGFGLPAGLLRAIGIVESGRWQPSLARSAPWPYAIDVGGYDLFMESLPDAVGKVSSLRQQGFESIDVGCFQINLMYHPEAFASLEEAFDPSANAAYAARFLLGLHARSGSWEQAVADYHSAVPELGEPYRLRVYAVWQGAPADEVAAGQGAHARLSAAFAPKIYAGWQALDTHGFVRVTGSDGRAGATRVAMQVFEPGDADRIGAAPPQPASLRPVPVRAIPARAVPAVRAVSMTRPALMTRLVRRRLPAVYGPPPE